MIYYILEYKKSVGSCQLFTTKTRINTDLYSPCLFLYMSTVTRQRRIQVRQPELIVNRCNNNTKSLNWLRILKKFPLINNELNESSGISSKVAGQVRLDVDRAFSFDSGVPNSIEDKREKLFRVIISVLSRNLSFKYYQVCLLCRMLHT